jgi:uncharacterized membrane protein YeaQ/YmgE (transglycosylase-associated protein family)
MLGVIVGAVVGGTILGYLGKLLLPGRQNIPAWATIGAGIVAGLLGGAVARWLGLANTRGIDWWEFIFQVGLAVLAIWAVTRMFDSRREHHRGGGTTNTRGGQNY